MYHDELKDKILKSFKGKIPISARETWAKFIKERQSRFFVRDEWVKDKRFEKWAMTHPDLEFSPREDGFTVEIMVFGSGGGESVRAVQEG